MDSFLVGAALLLAVHRVPSRVREGQGEQVALRRKRGLERLKDFPHWEMPSLYPNRKPDGPRESSPNPPWGRWLHGNGKGFRIVDLDQGA